MTLNGKSTNTLVPLTKYTGSSATFSILVHKLGQPTIRCYFFDILTSHTCKLTQKKEGFVVRNEQLVLFIYLSKKGREERKEARKETNQ